MTLILLNSVRDCRSKRWLLAHFDYPHKDFCLIWPFSHKGGGYAQISKGILVHRLMCEYRNGPPPSPEHHAAHSCGRGHDACVNPWHLNWRTPTENQLERFEQHGPNPQRKLTEESAAKIRDLKGFATADTIARMFGVSESNVRLIQSGKTWKASPDRKHVFTAEEIQRIRSTAQADGVAKGFAREFGVSVGCIQRIRSGQYYKHFHESAEAGLCMSPADREQGA